MIFYYREVESGPGPWIYADSKEYERKLADMEVFHIGLYHLSRRPEDDDGTPLKYQGGLLFDIDVEDLAVATTSTINLVNLLIEYEVDENAIEIWASGGKGYHIRISGKHFGGGRAMENLPLYHKYMASVLASRAKAEGVDLQRYCLGKGGTIRVENRKRGNNGKYKVPITFQELLDMTPESYAEITSEPRLENWIPAKAYESTELTLLFREAISAFDKPKNIKPGVAKEKFAELQDDPQCIKDVVANENIRNMDGAFNYSKMTIARYINCSGGGREDLILAFAENWTSKRHSTARDRERELRAAMRSVDDKEFPCDLVIKGLDMNPCKGCPLNTASKSRQEALASSSSSLEAAEGMVYEESGQYIKDFGKEPKAISNFVLSLKYVYYDNDGESRDKISKLTVNLKVVNDPNVYIVDMENPLRFNSKAKFKDAILGHGNPWFLGGENDPNLILSLLTTPEKLEGAEKMTESSKVGIVRHYSPARGIDELTWVQKGWSVNYKGIENTMTFRELVSRRVDDENKFHLAMDLRGTTGEISSEVASKFLNMLNVRDDATVARFLGYTAGCWLKPYIEDAQENSWFPVLQVFGPSGSGKSSLVRYWSAIAGANVLKGGMLAMQQITPASLRAECIVSTTVPRIIDEANPSKLTKDRWKALRDMMKSSAGDGGVGVMAKQADGTLKNTNTSVSSPLIIMGVAKITEAEIEQRTEQIGLIEEDTKNVKYRTAFKQVVAEPDFLKDVAGALMRESMVYPKAKVVEHVKYFTKLLEDKYDITDRVASLFVAILVGLEFAEHTFKVRCQTPEEVVGRIQELRNSYFDKLKDGGKFLNQLNERMVFMQYLSEMAATYRDYKGELVLKHDLHYIKTATHLHIRPNALFLPYCKYLREHSIPKEYQSHDMLKEDLRTHPAFLGVGIAPNVTHPYDWVTFDLSILTAGGLNVTRFDK